MTRIRRPPMRRAARAGDLVDALLAGWGLEDRLRQYRALVVWDEVVGPQIAARTRPERIRDGVLEVCVDQATWMQQLQLLKPQILARLNTRLGESPLREIFLKRGKTSARSTATPGRAAPAWRSAVLTAEENRELHQLVEGIGDEALRRELETLLTKQMKLTKARNS